MAYFRFMGKKVIFKSSSFNVALLRGGNGSGAWNPGRCFLEEFREAVLLMAFKVSDGRQRRGKTSYGKVMGTREGGSSRNRD